MTALRDMTADELRARLERIRELNPHGYARQQAYRNTAARLRRLELEPAPRCPKCGMLEHAPDRFCDTVPPAREVPADESGTRYWVVLSDGTLKGNLTPAQYDRYSERGLTIDGGLEA